MRELKIGRTPRMIGNDSSRRGGAQSAKLVAIGMLAVGGALAGCGANSMTAPDEGGAKSPFTAPQHDLVGTGVVTNLVPLKSEQDDATAQASPDFATSTETTFPVTETVTNTCHNFETPVLTGFMKVREKLSMDDLTLKYNMRTWKDTRGVFATAQTYWDDDNDPATPAKPILVRYRNRTNTLDMFQVGPAGLPFTSDQESVMLLERLSPEHGMRYGKYDDREDDDDDRDFRHGQGDDLFVYAKQRVSVDKNGVAREQTVFRTECR
jgi:hypothetical protein